MCLWSPLIHGFQSGIHYSDDGTRVHLTVEVMPGGTQWEWLAWIGRSPYRCRHGHAASAASARRLAEDAAVALDRRCSPTHAAPAAGPESVPAGGTAAERRRTSRRDRRIRLPGQAAAMPGFVPGRTLRPPRR